MHLHLLIMKSNIQSMLPAQTSIRCDFAASIRHSPITESSSSTIACSRATMSAASQAFGRR